MGPMGPMGPWALWAHGLCAQWATHCAIALATHLAPVSFRFRADFPVSGSFHVSLRRDFNIIGDLSVDRKFLHIQGNIKICIRWSPRGISWDTICSETQFAIYWLSGAPVRTRFRQKMILSKTMRALIVSPCLLCLCVYNGMSQAKCSQWPWNHSMVLDQNRVGIDILNSDSTFCEWPPNFDYLL